jgi:hypothetical protein
MQRASAGISSVICALLIFCIAPSVRSTAQIGKTVEEPYAAPSDQALLVFRRPRHRQASETEFRVVNQAGRCIALLENGWQVAAPMWPGKHMLLVVTGTAPPTVQLLEAKLSAGKTYVVSLRARVNVKSPVEIEVLRKAEQPLEHFPSAIKQQSPFKQDLRKCTEWVSWKSSKLGPKAELAKRKWDDADEGFRSEHTIRRNDGWTAAEVSGK